MSAKKMPDLNSMDIHMSDSPLQHRFRTLRGQIVVGGKCRETVSVPGNGRGLAGSTTQLLHHNLVVKLLPPYPDNGNDHAIDEKSSSAVNTAGDIGSYKLETTWKYFKKKVNCKT